MSKRISVFFAAFSLIGILGVSAPARAEAQFCKKCVILFGQCTICNSTIWLGHYVCEATCEGGCWVAGPCIGSFQSIQPNPAGVVVAALGTLLPKPQIGPTLDGRDCRGNLVYRISAKGVAEERLRTLREIVV